MDNNKDKILSVGEGFGSTSLTTGKPSPTKTPILWASVARIVACGFIFMYHFLVLHHISTPLGAYGLYIFFFLAGWFSVSGKKEPWEWLKARVKRILIPYWPVIFVVLVANRIVGYKETTLFKDAMTFAGLSMFVHDPVYVLSWFITMIVMLDISFFGFRMVKRPYMKVIYLLVVYLLFRQIVPMQTRAVILFYFGAGLSYGLKRWPAFSLDLSGRLSERFVWFRLLNEKLFQIQNYTYPFFLIHGAILIMLIRAMHITGAMAFVLALGLSAGSAYGYDKLLKRAFKI